MKDVLLSLVRTMVDHADDVAVDSVESEDRTMLTMHIHPEDMGKIIGKNGRIIRAIRDFMKILATKKGLYVDIALAEEETRPDTA